MGPAMSPLTLSLADIQREYLDDLRHRVTPAHYRNVEQRLRSTLAALGDLPEEEARIAVRVAVDQAVSVGGTNDYLITREFRKMRSAFLSFSSGPAIIQRRL